MSTATSKSAARKAGILDNSYLAQSALQEGFVAVHGAAEKEAILPANNVATGVAGVALQGGSAGAAMTAGTDMFDAQWNGRAKVQLLAGKTANRGDHLVPADSTGAVAARTLFSFSQFVLGVSPQTKTAGAKNDFIECDMAPQLREIVRSITVSQPLKTTVLGAATVFGATTGTAFGTAAIQLYQARYTGETVRALGVSVGIAPGGADTVIATIQKSTDGGNTWADTTITCTITGAGTAAQDLTHSVSLNAKDLLALKVVSSAGTAAGCCASFDIT